MQTTDTFFSFSLLQYYKIKPNNVKYHNRYYHNFVKVYTIHLTLKL